MSTSLGTQKSAKTPPAVVKMIRPFHSLHLAFLVKKSAKNRILHGNNTAFFHFSTETICYGSAQKGPICPQTKNYNIYWNFYSTLYIILIPRVDSTCDNTFCLKSACEEKKDKPKPSLKIGTANAISWKSIDLFKSQLISNVPAKCFKY